MVLEFILLLKNNNFKYIQRWKQTNLLHSCVKQIWGLMSQVSKARKWNCSAPQCKADPALLGGKGTKPTQPGPSAEQGSHLQFAILKQIPGEFRGFSSFFCWQSSAGSWAGATQPRWTERFCISWVLLPHTYKCSCLTGNLATAGSTESLQMLKFSDELDLGFSAWQIQSHFLKVLIAALCIYKSQMQMNAKNFPSSWMVHWPTINFYIHYTYIIHIIYIPILDIIYIIHIKSKPEHFIHVLFNYSLHEVGLLSCPFPLKFPQCGKSHSAIKTLLQFWKHMKMIVWIVF